MGWPDSYDVEGYLVLSSDSWGTGPCDFHFMIGAGKTRSFAGFHGEIAAETVVSFFGEGSVPVELGASAQG
jgi:hypothetical protein